MLKQRLTKLHLSLRKFQAQKVVLINTCPIARKLLSEKDRFPDDEVENPYPWHSTMFPVLHAHLQLS
jgi:hypothetical protein